MQKIEQRLYGETLKQLQPEPLIILD